MANETQTVKKSKKTRKLVDEEEITSRVDSSEVMDSEKERKKKSKKRAISEKDIDEEATDGGRKKQKRSSGDAEATNKSTGDVQLEDVVSKKKRKKDKARDQTPTNVQSGERLDTSVDVEMKKKDKKKSRKSKSKPKDDLLAMEDDSTESIALSKDKKKSKKKSNSSVDDPDPGLDETLSDKSRGALSYTWARIARPESWKFNKAHQNWIVKHVFSTDSIPDKYFATVVSYLQGCKGGVRQNLIQVCQQHIDSVEKPVGETQTDPRQETVAEDGPKALESETTMPVSAVAREDIMIRARRLISTLQLKDTS